MPIYFITFQHKEGNYEKDYTINSVIRGTDVRS